MIQTKSTSQFFKKIKIVLLLFISFLFSINSIFAQTDSLFIFKKPDSRYYHQRLGKWSAKSRTLGVIPEFHGFDYLTIGLSIAEIKSATGEGGIFGKAFQFGAEYIPTEKIIAPKIKYWKAGWIYFMGLNIGGSGLYYFKKDASSFALRPEIGLGIVYFQINYSYTFFFNDKFEELNPHGFSVSWYHTILPRTKRKK